MYACGVCGVYGRGGEYVYCVTHVMCMYVSVCMMTSIDFISSSVHRTMVLKVGFMGAIPADTLFFFMCMQNCIRHENHRHSVVLGVSTQPSGCCHDGSSGK